MFRALAAAALSLAVLAATATPAAAQTRQVSQKSVGSWSVIGWVSQGGIGYCSAERASADMTAAFARVPDGFIVIVRSPSLQLDQNGEYKVSFSIPSVTHGNVSARYGGPNMLMFMITRDAEMMARIAEAPSLELKIAGTTLRIALDGFGEALTELNNCFVERSRAAAPQPAPASEPARAPHDPYNMPRKHDGGTLKF